MRKDGIVSAEIAFSTDPGAGAKSLAGSAEEILRALEEAGRACAEAAKARAPVRTGRLRDSIRWTVVSDGGDLLAAVGTDVPYAAVQEIGTSKRPGKHYLAAGAAEAWKK
ncbi:MAG: HK97 gp10 family phage protein [Clostridia bacterium]|nr:HK97 gp10 family phage protein [Clostridia bacterium]